ncbi:MAG: glycosyltransferase [Roseomonas sp.]|nr:glycosyltransferase [Roseomonas sp.]
MRVTFLLHSNIRAGSSLVMFRGANALARAGHSVEIVFEERLFRKEIDFFQLAQGVTTRFVDEAAPWPLSDIVIFAWWQTAYNLHRVRARAAVFYLLGDAKPLYGSPALDLHIDLTYREPGLRYLHVNTDNAREELAEAPHPSILVQAGVDYARFASATPLLPPPPGGGLRVLVEGPPNAPHKRVEESIAALAGLPGVEIVHCSASGIAPADTRARAMSDVPERDLPGLFASCDLIAKLSKHETFALPVLECFAAGATAITTAFQGHADYIRHEENAIVVPLDDPWAEARAALLRLRDDRALLARLRQEAKRTAASLDWERFNQHFLRALENIAASAGDGQVRTPLLDRYAASMRAAVHLWVLGQTGK